MNAFHVWGGRRLTGSVDVPGSKNSALAIMSSVVLAPGQTVLHNVPDVSDTHIKAKLLERFGAKVAWREGSYYIDCSNVEMNEADEEIVRSIRTSFYLLGPMLARTGEVTLPAPGGCRIGARPVDFHLKGLRAMGARIDLTGGVYRVRAKRLHGAEIYLDVPSAGATQHLMATATLAEGHTVITNAAMEPEVTFLASFLKRMGARIEGEGTSTITIEGVPELKSAEFRVPPDRLQAGTYLLAGAITDGDVTVRGILPEDQIALVNKLREAGADIEEGSDWIRYLPSGRLNGIKVKTMPYPGFATDMQQPMAAVLSLARGTSVVDETIYESRIGHVQELNRMGAQIQLEGRTSIINGVESLRGSIVEASDLRAGAALVLAGLAAEGETIVKNIHWIDRGYERLEQLIGQLGGRIERVALADADPLKVGDNPS